MPFLLIVFLTLACLPEVGRDWPHPPWQAAPWCSALLTWVAVAGTVGWAWWLAHRVRRALEQHPDQRQRLLGRYERWRRLHQLALFGVYIAAMCLLGWGWAVGEFWSWGDGPDRAILPGAEILILSPFLAAMVLSWIVFYDGDRASFLAIHQPLALDPLARALLDQDRSAAGAQTRHLPVFGGRWAHVMSKVRQNLVLVFVPLLLLLGQKEVRRLFPQLAHDWETAFSLGGFVVVLAVFVCMPWIIRLVLNLKSLPNSPLRQRLLATAARLKFRCSDVLLWNTNNGMANAMVVGILPWPRYIVFTDKLLEDFTEEEVQAVFGHEVGHVKHHHMLYYLAFLTSSMVVLFLLLAFLCPSLVSEMASASDGGAAVQTNADSFLNLENHQYLRAVPMMLLLLVYIFVVFGFLSRRCERQADIYGCRAVSCPSRDCRDHDWNTVLDPSAGLCPTGIRVFIQALEKVALVNGISRDRPGFLQSWQHSTIAHRVLFLQGMLGDPAVEPRFQRRVLLVKLGLFVALGVVLLALVLHHLQRLKPASDAPTTEHVSSVHDRRAD